MQAATITVGATPVRLVGERAPVGGAGGQNVRIRNSHASDSLFVGGSNAVAANNGFPIPPGQTLDLGNLEPGDVVWAIRGGSADIAAQVLVK